MDKVINGENDSIHIGSEIFVPLFSDKEIQTRVKELGDEISKDFKGKFPIFIGILNGSFIFMSDLVKNISINCEIDFFKLSSYGDAKISSGEVKMLKELNADIFDRNVIIVEDIVDTGLSIRYILDKMKDYKPAGVSVASLLLKPESYKFDHKIDYIGFEIPNKFVIGYGLDYAQKYRNLKSIYVLKEN